MPRTSEVVPASRSAFARSEVRAPTSIATRTEGTRLSRKRHLTVAPRVPRRRPNRSGFFLRLGSSNCIQA